MVDFIFLHVVLDKRKQLIEYVGMACATDLRRTSLPALLAALPLQEPTRPLILAGKNSNASDVDRPMAVGRPRYLSESASVAICSSLRTTSLMSSKQFLLKKTADLSLFTCCPEPRL
jgi:hypothetical protein